MSRRFVWSNPEVQKLTREFVCVAEHVERITTAKGEDLRFVRKMLSVAPAEVRQEGTFQGTYVVTPDGRFLGGKFGEEKHPRHGLASTLGILRKGLTGWRAHARKQGIRSRPVPSPSTRPADGGLRLAVHVRDLPRKRTVADDEDLANAHEAAWNLKWITLTSEQAAALVPPPGKTRATVPPTVFRALTRDVTVDYVYDQGHDGWWDAGAVKTAKLSTEVTATKGSRVTLRLVGELDMQQDDRFGFEGRWLGTAVYDRKSRRFVSFSLVAVGMRMTHRELAHWIRRGDEGGLIAPMGLAYTLPTRTER